MRRLLPLACLAIAPAFAQGPAPASRSAVLINTLDTFCMPYLHPAGGVHKLTTHPAPGPYDPAESRRVQDIQMAEAGLTRPTLTDELRAAGWAQRNDRDFYRQDSSGVVTVDVSGVGCIVIVKPAKDAPADDAIGALASWTLKAMPDAVRVGPGHLNPYSTDVGDTDRDWWYDHGISLEAKAFPDGSRAAIVTMMYQGNTADLARTALTKVKP